MNINRAKRTWTAQEALKAVIGEFYALSLNTVRQQCLKFLRNVLTIRYIKYL
jgi:hypothetical protein